MAARPTVHHAMTPWVYWTTPRVETFASSQFGVPMSELGNILEAYCLSGTSGEFVSDVKSPSNPHTRYQA